MPEKIITYYHRGRVERRTKSGYSWHEGWSAQGENGGILYPWLTRLEALADAKRQGARAEFKEK